MANNGNVIFEADGNFGAMDRRNASGVIASRVGDLLISGRADLVGFPH